MHAHDTAPHFDELDPHHQLHAEHVIVRASTLLNVLIVLLVFTVLTVAASRLETWAAAYFNVVIPQWINVAVVLFIAVVKSALVAMYFMQLKYDSPLNSLVFLFCLFAFGLFLFFCMTDLATRDAVYSFKAGEVMRGGTGLPGAPGKAHYETVKERKAEEWGPEEFQRRQEKAHAAKHHGDEGARAPATADYSRPVKGPTGALWGEPAASGGHSPGH